MIKNIFNHLPPGIQGPALVFFAMLLFYFFLELTSKAGKKYKNSTISKEKGGNR